jgi:hypothetical protein
MFSHTINNTNNCPILTDKEYYLIPFGHRCSSALACKYSNLRLFSLPFDWTGKLFPKKIQNILENDFKDFIPDVHNKKIVNKYDVLLAHFNKDIDEGINEYKRRINRFNSIINEPKKMYFVYINEDYLYNNNYRTDAFNDTIFFEMLELELFIKKKYVNIDYNILYFNFKKNIIPPNSNIINILLNTNKFYDDSIGSNYQDLRKYCGKILSNIFNTQLNLGHDKTIFVN